MSRLRAILFALVCVVQLAIPLSMAYRYERTLRAGVVYRFHTEPIDPVDAFRGRYVAIRLQLQTAEDVHDVWNKKVYATLATDAQGFAIARTVSEERPTTGDWLRGTAQVLWAIDEPSPVPSPPPHRTNTRIELPFDRYYMEESKAPKADRIWSEGMRQAEATARVRVRNGIGAIEGIDINGVPIEQWVETLPPKQ